MFIAHDSESLRGIPNGVRGLLCAAGYKHGPPAGVKQKPASFFPTDSDGVKCSPTISSFRRLLFDFL